MSAELFSSQHQQAHALAWEPELISTRHVLTATVGHQIIMAGLHRHSLICPGWEQFALPEGRDVLLRAAPFSAVHRRTLPSGEQQRQLLIPDRDIPGPPDTRPAVMAALLCAATQLPPEEPDPVRALMDHAWVTAAAQGQCHPDWPQRYTFSFDQNPNSKQYYLSDDEPELTELKLTRGRHGLICFTLKADLPGTSPTVLRHGPLLRAGIDTASHGQHLNIKAWLNRVRGRRPWAQLDGHVITAEELIARPDERSDH